MFKQCLAFLAVHDAKINIVFSNFQIKFQQNDIFFFYKYTKLNRKMLKLEENYNVIEALGERLKDFRKSKGLKQKEFAIICGTRQNNLSEIENCRRGISDKILYNLILYFPDFDAHYIITGQKRELKTAVTEGVENIRIRISRIMKHIIGLRKDCARKQKKS